ncbi:MAG: site-specific integrase [Bacilli bacterium]|jgi:integrase
MNIKRDPENKRYWMIDTTVKFPDGRSGHLKRRGFYSKATAEAAYYRLESEFLLKRGYVLTKTTFDKLIDAYVEYKNNKVKPTTLYNVKVMIKTHISAFFNGQSLKSVYTVFHLTLFRKRIIAAENQQSWKNKIFRVFMEISEVAYLRKIIDSEMFRLAKLYSDPISGQYDPAPTYTVWSKEQYRDFINTFDKNDKYKVLFQWMFFSGSRIGETSAIQWKDYDPEKKTVWISKTSTSRLGMGKAVITSTKTKSGNRRIFLSDAMNSQLLALKSVFGQEPKKYLFFGYDNPIGYTSVLFVFKRHTKLAGLPHMKIHEIRHTNNTWLLNDHQSRAEADLITRRLGRSSLKVTLDTYYHTNPEDEKGLVDKIEI